MANEVIVSRYREFDREPVFEFLRMVYSRERSAQLIAQWDWKYVGNPFTRKDGPYVLLARADNAIVGMLGATPLRVHIRGKEQWVMNSGDGAVHPGFRRQGIAMKMARVYIRDHPLGFGWANPISFQGATQSKLSPGTRLIPQVKLLLPEFFSRILARAQFKPALQATPVGLSIHRIETIDERFDSLWERARGNYAVMVVRDRAYLSWRFATRPDAQYAILGATRENHFVGYLVIRIVKKNCWRLGYMVDWLIEDDSFAVFAALARQGIADLYKLGAAFITARTLTPRYFEMLSRLGFFSWTWSRPEYLLTRVNASDPALQIFANPGEWFLTMGDGDLETSQ